MDFFDVIERRYSHKEKFLPTPVPIEHLEKLAIAGLLAPSGANAQSVNLVLLPDREALNPINEIIPHPGLDTAPAAIALLTDSSTQKSVINFEIQDYSAACENIHLAATAMGYGSLWLDYPLFNEAVHDSVLKVLNAPEGFCLRVIIPIGLIDGEGSRREKLPLSTRLHYVKM